MIKTDKHLLKKFVLLITMIMLISACHVVKPNIGNSDSQTFVETPPPTPVFFQESAVVYQTFEEIVEVADIIIIGSPNKMMKLINTARDPKYRSKPDSEYSSIGQVYEVQVDRYLFGDGLKSIFVIQNQGYIPSNFQEITEANIKDAQKKSDTIPLTLGKQYVMFLNSSDLDYADYKRGEIFFGVGHPWKFAITDSYCVQLEDSISSLSRNFPIVTLDDFLIRIDSPESIMEVPYPAPAIPEVCIPIQSKVYP